MQSNQRTDGLALLISDKIDFKYKFFCKIKEGHYILITESIHQEDITILNTNLPNRQSQTLEAKIYIIERRNRQFYNNEATLVPFQ